MSDEQIRNIVSIIEEMGGHVKDIKIIDETHSCYLTGTAMSHSIYDGTSLNLEVAFGPHSYAASKEVLDDLITVMREQNLRRQFPELREAYEAYKVLAKLYS